MKVPYHFGAVTELLNEVPLRMHTGSWRSVYSATTRGAEEIMVDEIAKKLGKDPVAFRLEFLKTDRQRAVLNKVASAGRCDQRIPPSGLIRSTKPQLTDPHRGFGSVHHGTGQVPPTPLTPSSRCPCPRPADTPPAAHPAPGRAWCAPRG